ncbi:MAG: hypothetical protein JSW62_01315 [Thermoplasmatales archaeon]|nr:MAG: hypothetical protein JSW62_01315 [Thermoplasmatales archaeon]
MSKEIKTIMMILIISMMFVSFFTVSCPTSSAGFLMDAYTCRAEIEVDYDEAAANAPILPIDMVKKIPVTINYRVNGLYDEVVTLDYQDEDSVIDFVLEVEDTPQWCDASIIPSVHILNPLTEWQSMETILNVKVYETAHAFRQGQIKLKIKVASFGAIKGGIFLHNISFTPGYLPILKIDSPEMTYGFLNPGETKTFDLELENIGNAKTNVMMEVLKAPEDWTISTDSNIILGTKTKNEETKQTVSLTIRSSDSFGYHDDREVIQLKFIPSYFENESMEGSEYIVSFIIKNKGFSTPGFEALPVLVMFALVSMALSIKKRKDGGKNK